MNARCAVSSMNVFPKITSLYLARSTFSISIRKIRSMTAPVPDSVFIISCVIAKVSWSILAGRT